MISDPVGGPSTETRTSTDTGADAAFVRELLARSAADRRPGAADLARRAVWSASGQDGLVTVVLHADDLDPGLDRMVHRFRLAEFLRLGLMDAALARSRGMDCEPSDRTRLHTIAFDGTGRVVGYLALVATADACPLALDDPTRSAFPVEGAHDVDLVSRFAAPGLSTARVHEIKRFVRAGGLPVGAVRDRIPWHLILGLGRSVLAMGGEQLLVGDSREDGALRHFRLLGFDPLVLPDTRPHLPRTALMWPSYEGPTTARPFAGSLPADLGPTLDAIEALLGDPDSGDWQRRLLRTLRGRVST